MTRKRLQRSLQLEFNWRNDAGGGDTPPASASPQAENPVNAIVELPQPTHEYTGYGPGHPWHYHRRGDGAEPMRAEDIPASKVDADCFKRDLPKTPAKRRNRLRALLEEELPMLERTIARYQEVVARGAEALNRYDRAISYNGDDEMARAGTLALLFNHISWHRGRLAWLQTQASGRIAK